MFCTIEDIFIVYNVYNEYFRLVLGHFPHFHWGDPFPWSTRLWKPLALMGWIREHRQASRRQKNGLVRSNKRKILWHCHVFCATCYFSSKKGDYCMNFRCFETKPFWKARKEDWGEKTWIPQEDAWNWKTWWFKVTFLGWLSDPFKGLSDLQLGDQKITLNHLEIIHFQFPPWDISWTL